ncbi:hypothetical protein NE237_015916 [Protea cynaroides]|uniref:Acyl-[acyl-carrier-protein] hydrolase n=1 Tax=Protea cynaroides TaxID=273540 RepID=A0A9Q0KEY7_9MAGN|nr:hypothetical protein NE237_015916 [Protea cynaroides]
MMSLKGCHVPDQLRSLTQCRSIASPKALNRHRTSVVPICSSATPSSSLSVSQVSELAVSERPYSSTNESATLPNPLRLGTLTDNGRSYKEKFIVRIYEVGSNKTATIEAIANLMQEAACNQMNNLGFSTNGMGTTNNMRKLHIIWVTTRMHIEVYKYPAWGDMVEIETWFEARRLGARRDFILKDATGTVIGRASSKWVAMNTDTRRLQKVHDDVLEEIKDFSPRTPRFAFPKEDNSLQKKIPRLEEPAQYSKLGLMARRANLDMNQHVNNVTYIGWLLESLPQELIDTHELRKVTLDYRQECRHDHVVDSFTSMELMDDAEAIPEFNGTNGSATQRKNVEDSSRFLHFVKFSDGGREINRGCSEWIRKSTR